MKKTLLFIAAAVMFVLAGCQKDQYIQESKKNDIIHINVGQIAPATRVAAVDIDAAKLSFKFEEGDEVAFLNANTMGITEFTCTNPATGEFEKTDGDALDPDGEYLVVYPVFAPDYLFISGGVYPQNYRANQIPKEHVIISNGGDPVSGASTEFNLDYHFGIIHFQLKGNAKIGSIEYQSKDSEGGYDEVSSILHCGEGVQLSDTPTHFYMDVISTTRFGFKLTFKDASGNELGKQESNFGLNANKGKMVDFATPLTVNAAAPTTTGTAKRTGDIDVNWVQLWDGGPKFAEYNVGAENNKPEDYGCLYGWGGTQDKNKNDYNKGSVPLTGDYDTATNLWGSNWRMPTQEEFHALPENVNCTWTENYNGSGVNGWLCTGKGAYSSNSIFLPAAGFFGGVIIMKQNDHGRYWSSTPDDEDFSVFLTFTSDDSSIDVTYHKYGQSVRAVLK